MSKWLCEKDRKLIENWKTKFQPEYGNILTKNGKLRLKELGQRYAARLPSLIKDLNVAETFVQSTNINRTIDSAQEFIKGLLENWYFKPDVKTSDSSVDYLLKYPDLCENFIKV
jgi:hypothetical protein